VQRFDSTALYEALDRQRLVRGLTWGDAAREIGVSVATITRARRGGPIELEARIAMVAWLKVPVEHFVKNGSRG
jgi:hypothetical protein